MFVPLDSWTHRKLLLKQGVCLLQQRLQLSSPEIKKKKMLIMQFAKKESLKQIVFAAFTWNSQVRILTRQFSPLLKALYRWLPKFYRSPSPIPPHVCCQNWRKIQICPLCCSGSLMSDDTSFSYLWALAVSSPPPMQRPPMNTRGTDDAPVSWGSK